MAANMWKNSLKNVDSDNNKILYETLIDFFLQRNGSYFLNKPRNLFTIACTKREVEINSLKTNCTRTPLLF